MPEMNSLSYGLATLAFAGAAILAVAMQRRSTPARAGKTIKKLATRAMPGFMKKMTGGKKGPRKTRPGFQENPNYRKYRAWRGDRHHGIQPESQDARQNSPPPKCASCQDTRSIIRGHDGQKIRCPSCR